MKVLEKIHTDWLTKGRYELQTGQQLLSDFTSVVLDFNKYIFERHQYNLPEEFIRDFLLITRDKSKSEPDMKMIIVECVGHLQGESELVFSFDFPHQITNRS